LVIVIENIRNFYSFKGNFARVVVSKPVFIKQKTVPALHCANTLKYRVRHRKLYVLIISHYLPPEITENCNKNLC